MDSTVSLINPTNDTVELTRAVQGAPSALAPVRNGVWVAGDAPQLTLLAPSGQTRATTIPSSATALATGSGRLLVGVRGTGVDHRGGTLTVRVSDPLSDIDPSVCCNTPPDVTALSYDSLGQPAFAPAPPGIGIRPGTGPYRIDRLLPNDLIVLTRNPYFHVWAPAAQPAGYPNQIVIYTNGTPATDIPAVLSGRADYTVDTPSTSQLRDIQLRSPDLLHTEPLPDTDFLDLNTRLAPFNNVDARQGLNLAINRDAIVNLYGGPDDASPTCQIIPASIAGHVPYCPYTLAHHPTDAGARRTSREPAGWSRNPAPAATPSRC